MSKSTSKPAVAVPGARSSPRAREHAETQRHRILDAAERCFIEQGFHAAGMARISKAAGISTGLIYRYFENKHAIILAIIERQLQEKRADIASLQTSSDLAGRIHELIASWQHCDPRVMNPALFLEMSAEASRDPAIARALGNADQLSRSDFSAWLKRVAGEARSEVTDEEIQRRAFALQCFIEGMLIRIVREPEITPAMLADSIQLILRHVLFFKEK